MTFLKFSKGNAKLDKNTLLFSLPAGYTCPNAGVCRTYADKATGRIMDNSTEGDVPSYRCFASSQEAVYPSVRRSRWANYEALQEAQASTPSSCEAMRDLIQSSLERQPALPKVRIHVSGDFFSELYMQAWLKVAKARPEQIFYCYTKSLNYWYQLRKQIPGNFYMTASWGGSLDNFILRYPRTFKRNARVVYTEAEAMALGLPIDHDDSHCLGQSPFTLLVHGSQPKGSDASKAISKRRKEGAFTGYSA